MTSWAHRTSLTRLAASIAAAGFFLVTPAVAQTQLPPPSFGQADTRQDRIEELEQQLREATAENERMQFELNQAQREITRLRGLVGELSSVNQSLGQAQPPAAAAAPAPRQTGQLGTLPASELPGDAGQAYSQARELLVAGRYPEAELAFGRFLQAFPEAETAADARFWFAFTLLARNNYTDAAANFVQYLQVAPSGPRAPEAQVRLGMALIGMGQTRQGCSAFASLARRYPNAPRNVRDLAQREARAANCAA